MDRQDRQHSQHSGRMLIPMLIILILPIAAMVAYILYHKKADALPAIQPDIKPPVSFGADNWPVFRGDPQLTGQAQGRLPDTLKLAWTFKTDGEILSTPVIAGNTAFVASMDKHLYALNLNSGKEIWRFEADDELEASPLYHDGGVYIGSSRGTFYALEAATGTVRWTFNEAGKIAGSANIAITDDNKSLIVFGSYDSNLYALDAKGQLAVTAEADNYINGAVAIDAGTAFFGSCDANVYCIPLTDPDNMRTIDAGSYVASNPTVADGIVYAGSYEGSFLAGNVATGEVLWQYNDAEDAFFSSPAVNDTVVVVGCRNSQLYCFDRTDGTINWTFETSDNFDSSPVICGDKIIVGNDDGRLYVIDLAKGTEVFSYTLGDSVAGSPAVAQNHILIGCANGTLYAFTTP